MTDTRITDFEAVAPMPIYTQADLDAAVQKEREACAKLCDAGAEQMLHAYKREGAARCALAIRKRNNHD